MVLVHPNPPPGQGFTRFYMGGDLLEEKRTENNSDSLRTASFWKSGPRLEDPSKKVRKPYTITKSRESWSEQEHEMFLEALHLFDRDWKKIEAFIGSKSVIQIRSHAQKYFLKVQKNGSGSNEHVPPPRPKRKAAHPYPQKAQKRVHRNTNGGAPLSPWTYNRVSTGSASRISKVTPDFAQVYRFIGSVFDPNASDHLQRLKMMDPVSVETVLMLMRNLSANLVSPEFEDHRRLISSYSMENQIPA